MAKGKKRPVELPEYGTVMMKGVQYYRTRITDADGKRMAIYGLTREELYDRMEDAQKKIAEAVFHRENSTVEEYCEKWLLMVPLSKGSSGMYGQLNMLIKNIFNSAEESKVIKENPSRTICARGGKPAKRREALTDEQTAILLDSIRELPPYVFVMIGLYAGLRREEILGLKWDCVFLDDAGVDPKTVQYLAGHENSKTTMDIYARVKYNKPEELFEVVNQALALCAHAVSWNHGGGSYDKQTALRRSDYGIHRHTFCKSADRCSLLREIHSS